MGAITAMNLTVTACDGVINPSRPRLRFLMKIVNGAEWGAFVILPPSDLRCGDVITDFTCCRTAREVSAQLINLNTGARTAGKTDSVVAQICQTAGRRQRTGNLETYLSQSPPGVSPANQQVGVNELVSPVFK